LEQANGGVLFLDEIGDMPLTMQSRLLRVLQERSVMRLGSSEETPIDILIICATHHQLTQLVAEGKFREDLYYRLNGHTLQMPSLRTRTDIVEIVIALLRRWSNGSLSSTADLRSFITERALTRITEYSWPGNIRQLENVIRALLAMRDDDPIDLIDLPDFLQQRLPGNVDGSNSPRQGKSLEAVQIRAIRAAVQTHRGNISSAARALGISRGTLYKKLRLTEN
jgi:transcriptional regulator of acetoin/glycerol metabolism